MIFAVDISFSDIIIVIRRQCWWFAITIASIFARQSIV